MKKFLAILMVFVLMMTLTVSSASAGGFKDALRNLKEKIGTSIADRQEEARNIASKVDMMIVVGDSKSSNTQKLYEICSRECKCTLYVQDTDNLEKDPSGSLQRVGITAGASTPKNIIEEVQNYVRINF